MYLWFSMTHEHHPILYSFAYLRYWSSRWWLWLVQSPWRCWLLWKTGTWFQDGDAWRHGAYCSINLIQSVEVQPLEPRDQRIWCYCSWPVLGNIFPITYPTQVITKFKYTLLNKIEFRGVSVEGITFSFTSFPSHFHMVILIYVSTIYLIGPIYIHFLLSKIN